MNNNKKILLFSISAVLVVLSLIAGGTYAYFTWTTSTSQRTNVVVTLDGASMIIDGGGNINENNMVPCNCNNETYAIRKKIKVIVSNTMDFDVYGYIYFKLN